MKNQFDSAEIYRLWKEYVSFQIPSPFDIRAWDHLQYRIRHELRASKTRFAGGMCSKGVVQHAHADAILAGKLRKAGERRHE